MKKFSVMAREIIYYEKTIECESEEELRDLLRMGEIMFNDRDISFSDNFELDSIVESEE
jgi:hypothetical protein